MIRVKVCCINSVYEAKLAIQFGASALGLVSEMPSGPGVISLSQIAEIAAFVPPPIATFLLTSKTDADEIISQQRLCGVNTVQICDCLPEGTNTRLRSALPGISLVQVIHVADEQSVSEAKKISREVDALLLDSGNQKLPIKELGGTGRTHDWSLSARIVKESSAPVFLAGGLNAQNVRDAIKAVKPFGVDLCTGVRTEEGLDEIMLRDFMRAVSSTPN